MTCLHCEDFAATSERQWDKRMSHYDDARRQGIHVVPWKCACCGGTDWATTRRFIIPDDIRREYDWFLIKVVAVGLLICAVAIALVVKAEAAPRTIECRATASDGRGWVWRKVDGKRCWYRGPRRIAKSRLTWKIKPAPVFEEESEIIYSEDDLRLMQSYWPDLENEPARTFVERWQGVIR